MRKSEVNPEICLVSGKGGVGKSSFAAALAQAKALQGKNVLLVELGETSYLELVYNRKSTYAPQEISKNLHFSLWNGESCLKEFISHFIPIDRVVNLFFDNKVMHSFIQAAPALKELAVLGKLTSVHRQYGPKMKYDTIVVDAYSSGHFLSLLRVPGGMAEAVRIGPMGVQSRLIDKILRDPGQVQYYIVTLPEELPVQETKELLEQLYNEFGQSAILVANKFLPSLNLEAIDSSHPAVPYLERSMVNQKICLETLSPLAKETLRLPFLFEVEEEKKIQKLMHLLGEGEASV